MQMNETRPSIALVLAADDAYARPMAVAIFSALQHLRPGWGVHLYLIDGGIQPHNKERIEQVVSMHPVPSRVHWRSVPADELCRLPLVKLHPGFSKGALLRLWIPDLLPGDCRKAIYLDSDVLVRGDLVRLWQWSLATTSLCAVRDYWIPFVSSPNGLSYYEEVGIDPFAPYFNSGVMLLNLQRWRSTDVHSRAMEHLGRFAGRLCHNDQEGLNAVLADDWEALPATWNVQHDCRFKRWDKESRAWPDCAFKRVLRATRSELLSNYDVLHFTGSRKPWVMDGTHPASAEWFRFFWESGWCTPAERIASQTRFAVTQLTTRVRNATRPARHRLALHLPPALQCLMRKGEQPASDKISSS